MCIHLRPSLLPLLALAFCSSFACNDTAAIRVAAPSTLSSTAPYVARAVSIHPAVVDAQVRPAARCPADPPLLAPVNLVIDAGDVAALALSRVQMQFVDTLGLRSGITTFTQADLTTRFGSTVIPASGTRTFPLAFPFGCFGRPSGILTVFVFVVDPFGRESRTSWDVRIRTP